MSQPRIDRRRESQLGLQGADQHAHDSCVCARSGAAGTRPASAARAARWPGSLLQWKPVACAEAVAPS
eukprot:6454688-Prorocentrum_lima.AAC.1